MGSGAPYLIEGDDLGGHDGGQRHREDDEDLGPGPAAELPGEEHDEVHAVQQGLSQ